MLFASIAAISPNVPVVKFCEQVPRASVTNNTSLSLDLMPLLICLPWSNRPHHLKNLSPECVWWVLHYNSAQSLHLSERALTVSLISLVVTKELSCGNREHQSMKACVFIMQPIKWAETCLLGVGWNCIYERVSWSVWLKKKCFKDAL